MSDWATFAVATVALTLLLLFFTRRSRRALERARFVGSRSDTGGTDPGGDTERDGDVDSGSDDGGSDDGGSDDSESVGGESADDPEPTADADRRGRPVITTRLLLVNAAVSQALALGVLAAIAWWTAAPASAFGIGGHPTLGPGPTASLGRFGPVALGVAAGLLLAAGNEATARLGARAGVAPSTRLREALAPTDAAEWLLLLAVALPVVRERRTPPR